ncbi:MAG TPA: hypothetical protein VM243_00660 [Phycisphaerae bacterium]|nr:hypothetical protein [Phycisphaerae bacterium]
MRSTHRFGLRTWIALATLFGGGLLPGTCEMRSKQALVDGSKSFLTSVLLDPGNITDLAFQDLANALTGNTDDTEG